MTMRVTLIGCVDSSLAALETLLAMPRHTVEVVGLITRKASKFNADFVNLLPLAEAHRIPALMTEDAPSGDEQLAWLRYTRPDLVFCVGWSQLLDDRMLSVAPRGTVGFHPAALPLNRGRHPLIWALVLGLDATASSFFLMDTEADHGPLLSQVPISIAYEDDAASLYAKVLAVIPQQIRDIVCGLSDGSLTPQPQDHALATQWRKRAAADGRIDWRMGAESVRNLVRGLTKPYPGAHFVFEGVDVKVWRCEAVDAGSPNLEPGKVLDVQGRSVTVKCGSGAVRLLEHEMAALPAPGGYL